MSFRMEGNEIADVIVDETWTYRLPSGETQRSRVVLGRPQRGASKAIWVCPVYFEHVTSGIIQFEGKSPSDALEGTLHLLKWKASEWKDVRRRSRLPG